MSSVDDRIVNMQFNNKQFVDGASESQKALESLDHTIAKTGQGSGLTTMGTAVDGISAKFSAMQVAGVAALATIVSKATTAGLGLIKSLTLDPITQGFSEYQTNLNSIQTVMANTGESVDVVNGYMKKLNTYSDQTIYNFSEMAKNIGTFTAAGVDLETATAAIKGIANLAALSGSNSHQAATAMYQLSQAIAAGRVGLMDWNSVVNAGMGGKKFQTALAQNAIAMGELSASAVDFGGKMGKLTVNSESFRTSISAAAGGASWLSSDVLVKTLSLLDGRLASASYEARGLEKAEAAVKVEMQQAKLAAEGYSPAIIKAMTETANAAYESATVVKTLPQMVQVLKESIGSIWSNTFQLIMGNFSQSKRLWTRISKQITGPEGIVSQMGNAWMRLLRGFAKGEGNGRTKLIKGFARLGKSVMRIFGAIRDAFRDVFPPATSKGLIALAKSFNQFTKKLLVGKDTAEDLRSIFGGIFAVLHIGVEIVKGIAGAFTNFFGEIFKGSEDARGGIFSIFGSIGEVLKAFDKWLTAGGKMSDSIANLGTVAGKFVAPFLQGIGLIIKGFATLVSGGGIRVLTDQFDSASDAFSAFYDLLQEGLEKLRSLFDPTSDSVDRLGGGFETLKTKVQDFLASGPSLSSVMQGIGSGLGTLTAEGINIAGDIVAGLASGIATAAPVVWAAMGDLATSMIDAFKSVMGIHSPARTMEPTGESVVLGIIEGIFKMLNAVGTAIMSLGKGIIDAFDQLFGEMDALDWAGLTNGILTSILLLNANSLVFTLKSFEGIGESITNTFKLMQNSIKAAIILDIAIAVGLLVAAIVILSLLDPKDIGNALGAIAALMGILIGSMQGLMKIGSGFTGSITAIASAIFIISSAMVVLSLAVVAFGNMDTGTLAKGMGAVAVALGIFTKTLQSLSMIPPGAIEGVAGSIFVMASAMVVLALAVVAFGNMDMGTLAKGLGAVAIGVGIFQGTLQSLSAMPPGSIEGVAGAIMVMALAMNVLVIAVAAFGNMNMKTLAKGFGAIALGLGLFIGALWALAPLGPQAASIAGAMMLMALAMIELAIAVGMFGSMDMSTLAKGFGAVTVGLLLLIGAAFLAQFVIPGLAALGVTIALIGAGMFLAGAGMLFFATGLSLLVVVGTAGIAIMSAAILAFIALLPLIAQQVAYAFVAFVEVIAAAAPRLREAFATIFENMLGVVTDAMPMIAELMIALIDMAITVLEGSLSRWVEMGFTLLDNFLQSMADHVPHIADVVGQMIEDFLVAVGSHVDPISEKAVWLIKLFLRNMREDTRVIAYQIGLTMVAILDAINDAIEEHTDEFHYQGARMARLILEGLAGGLGGKVADMMDLPSGDLGGVKGQPKEAAVNPLQSAQTAVATAAQLVNADVSQGDPTVAKAQKKALQASAAAEIAASKAAAAQKLANEKAKKAEKKGASKAAKKAAEEAQKEADKLAVQSQKAQNKADTTAQNLSDVIAFRDADAAGKGDIRSDEAEVLAQKANDMLALANAEAKKAKELTGKAKDKMLAQAKKHAKEAQKLADKAKAAQEAANKFYAKELQDRLDELAAEEKAEKENAEYEAADQAGKIAIKQKQAEEQKKKAADAKVLYALYLKQAKEAAAAGNYDKANKLLDKAEEQAKIAKEAAAAAQAAADDAKDLAGGAGGAGGGGIQPSKSVLEDAAKAVDHYTESLAQATELASGTPSVVQYTQNNYSPTSLSAAEIYRNSKNLLSAELIKMGEGGEPGRVGSGGNLPTPGPQTFG